MIDENWLMILASLYDIHTPRILVQYNVEFSLCFYQIITFAFCTKKKLKIKC